ncbi:MAG: hypothetical protein ABII22_03565 [Candidatus Micrarchaeota archaeon]
MVFKRVRFRDTLSARRLAVVPKAKLELLKQEAARVPILQHVEDALTRVGSALLSQLEQSRMELETACGQLSAALGDLASSEFRAQGCFEELQARNRELAGITEELYIATTALAAANDRIIDLDIGLPERESLAGELAVRTQELREMAHELTAVGNEFAQAKLKIIRDAAQLRFQGKLLTNSEALASKLDADLSLVLDANIELQGELREKGETIEELQQRLAASVQRVKLLEQQVQILHEE